MKFDTDDTIVAHASPPDPAARAIIRVSGPSWADCLQRFHSRDHTHFAALREPSRLEGIWRLGDDAKQRTLPCSLFIWPTDRSYTGQPAAELHTIGSPPLVERIVQQISQCGARLARAGEFTQRAFLTGRIDLTQAEAVLGVIDAENRQQLENALQQLAGGLSEPLSDLRLQLLNLTADVEAGLDFVDEDIEFVSTDAIIRALDDTLVRLNETAQQLQTRHRSNELPSVVLVGAPNAGKSTLWNTLLGNAFREIDESIDAQTTPTGPTAIVSDTPGTTRDYLAAECQFAGQHFKLIDTAGIDDSLRSPIDQAAQQLSERALQEADVVVLCVETGAEYETELVLQKASRSPNLVVLTKSDLAALNHDATEGGDAGSERRQRESVSAGSIPRLEVSAKHRNGIAELQQAIVQVIGETLESRGGSVTATATRCQRALQESIEAANHAKELAERGGGHELIAEELRRALNGLGEIVGAIYTDDILDRVFQRFCIGK